VGESAYEIDLLGFRARVSGPPDLVRPAERLTPAPPPWTAGRAADSGAAAGAPATPQTSFQLQWITTRGRGRGRVRLTQDGLALLPDGGRDEALATLLWAINSAAIRHLRERYLLFHAGVVARDGQGFLLPAPAGEGKTTLVAGLLGAGFAYLGDDIAAVERETLTLLPFTKSLALKAGSVRALARHLPGLGPALPRLRAGGETVWYLPPPARSWPSGPLPLRYVILPGYRARARTALVPISRADALARMLEQSFGIATYGGRGVAATVELVRRAECYALTVGGLAGAVRLLSALADKAPATAAPARRAARPSNLSACSG
jgi:hypothetical protein